MSRTGKAMAGAIFGLLLVLILISAPAFAQTPINDKCEDKCVDSILYLKGIWDIKLMECVYAYEQPCKYGCEDIATISKTPSCKEFPDKPPTNSTDYDETLWNMLRTMYQKKEDSVTMQIHGTEYSPYERGKVFLQLLGDDSTPINDSYCYCSIYYPDGFVKWKNEQYMTYSDDGLYFYPFTTPVRKGVYMVSAYCVIPQPNATVYNSEDGFESNSISGGSGDWYDDWYLGGNANIATTNPYNGTYDLRLRGSSGYADRPATSSDSVDKVVVSFWARAKSLESSDYGYFTFCGNNDTSNCTTSEEWTDGDDDDVWHYYTYTFLNESYNWSQKVWLEFDTTGFSGTGDYLFIDDVNVEMLKNEYNSSEYQVVRGSGEVVVRENLLYRYAFTDGYINDTEGDEFGGTAYLNFTLTSLVSENTSVEISISEFDYYYCTDILEFRILNGSSWENVTDFECYYDSNEGQSIMTFTQLLEPSETYQYYFKLRSKWLRNFYNLLDSVNETGDTIYGLCGYYFNKTNQTMPQIPLNGSHTELVHGYTEVAKWCTQGLDLLWHIQEKENEINEYNYSYGSNTSFVAMFQLLEALKELDTQLYPQYRNYYDMIVSYFSVSASYSNDNAKQEFFNGTYNPFDIFGNASTQNYIYQYLHAINSTVYLNNQTLYQIQDFQLNELSSNLTEIQLYLADIDTTTNNNYNWLTGMVNLSAFDVWSYSNRTLTDYNQTEIINLLNSINTTLYNLTIGNITVSAYVNWTEGVVQMNNISNPTVVEAQVLSFAGANQDDVVTTTYQYCIDNMTLGYDINTTRCWLSNCYTINETVTEPCDYGCYNHQCNPKPFDRTLFLIGIFALIFAGLVIIALLYDRFQR